MKKLISYVTMLATVLIATACNSGNTNSCGKPELPKDFAGGQWKSAGDIKIAYADNGDIIIKDGLLFNDGKYGNAEYKFRLRAPEGASQVQAWASFRVKDIHNRYTVGIRGGNNNHLYMARYADDANARFLGFAPLEEAPKVGKWYDLRVVTVGKTIQVYLNNEDKPRLVMTDDTALWQDGGIGIGESFVETEFSQAQVRLLGDKEAQELAKIKAPKQAYEPWKPSFDKEKKRAENRAAYKPFKVADVSAPRTEVSLNGDWLFMPIDQLPDGAQPTGLDCDDSKWHTLAVPSMWVPPLAWVHGETAFPYLEEPARGRTASDKLRIEEIKKVLGYTFDWDKTKAAWYRNYIELPQDIKGKRFELKFDAIATISKIFVNGKLAGSHVGMFGEVVCDITKFVKPGKNVVAVEVFRQLPKKNTSDVKQVAVTVEVTEDMVNSLPKAFYTYSPAGIWQPAKLLVTNEVSVKDVFVKPDLKSATFEVEIANSSDKPQTFDLSYSIAPAKERSITFRKDKAETLTLKAGETKTVEIKTPELDVKNWTPTTPHLYYVGVNLTQNGKLVDSYKQEFGFRTIGVKGNRIYLNGHPYWLRGANHFPHAARANDSALAHKFLKLARENSVNSGRLHVGPITETWAQAADEEGFLFSVEGIWPWLMIKQGEIPNQNLLDAWANDWASIVKKYRNHPSVGLWTVNNEMKFSIFDRGKKDILKKKWQVVDKMIKRMRAIDPTRPIVADSGYVRKEGSYQDYLDVVKANNLDDGDIDDIHRYYGWYDESFMHHMDNGMSRHLTSPDRPFISQEMSTGYCNENDGLPSRGYLFMHHTPQALIGDYAYEHNNPDYFLKRQSFMTKELGELFRRKNRDNVAGILHFGFVTWFKDSHFADTIEPRIGVKNMKKFLSPVMVSLELFGRHFWSGQTISRDLYVANDSTDFSKIPDSTLTWSVVSDGKVLASGSEAIKAQDYYTTVKYPVKIKLPEVEGRVDAQIVLKLEAKGKIISQNDYDAIIASKKWATESELANSGTVAVFDPEKKFDGLLSGFKLKAVNNLKEAEGAKVLVIANLKKFIEPKGTLEALDSYVKNGGKVLLLNPEEALLTWKGGKISAPEKFRGKTFIASSGPVTLYRVQDGEIVNMKVPESPVFKGIKPMDMVWFADEGSRKVPLASTAVYQFDRSNKNYTELAENLLIHGYLQKPADVLKYKGATLLEIRDGKGEVLVSSMRLTAAKSDPIAQKLLTNLVSVLLK